MSNEKRNTTSNTEMVTISREEYEKLQSQQGYISELEQQNQWLMEQLRLAQRRQFGSRSEKASNEVLEQMSLLFDEAEATSAIEKAEEKSAPVTEVKAHQRKKSGSVRGIVSKDIPVKVVPHGLSEEETVCPQCGDQMEVIGKEVRETLVFKPAEAYIRQDVYYTYGCRRCDKEDISTPVAKTPKEPALIPGGYASAEAVAHIAVQKFVMYAPLYRQELEWNRRGIQITRQTMSNWLLRCAEDWLEPIYAALHRELLKCDLLHSDETSLQVLHEPGKTSQSKSSMWLYRTSGDVRRSIVLYEYQPGKDGKYPAKFLDGFHGYLQTDGASYYNAVEGVTHIGCWAHARRKFEEALMAVPKGNRAPTAEQGMAYCQKLFDLEKGWKNLSPEDRKEQRLEQAKPVLDAFYAWANTRAAAPKSKLGQALTYLRNQWPYLCNYLLDGRLELSNNRAERSIKPFVMGRKNWLFANTPAGAKSSAVIYSLIETAKENGLDPYRYLCWVLGQAPRLSMDRSDWAQELVPEKAPLYCMAHSEKRE